MDRNVRSSCAGALGTVSRAFKGLWSWSKVVSTRPMSSPERRTSAIRRPGSPAVRAYSMVSVEPAYRHALVDQSARPRNSAPSGGMRVIPNMAHIRG